MAFDYLTADDRETVFREIQEAEGPAYEECDVIRNERPIRCSACRLITLHHPCHTRIVSTYLKYGSLKKPERDEESERFINALETTLECWHTIIQKGAAAALCELIKENKLVGLELEAKIKKAKGE